MEKDGACNRIVQEIDIIGIEEASVLSFVANPCIRVIEFVV